MDEWYELDSVLTHIRNDATQETDMLILMNNIGLIKKAKTTQALKNQITNAIRYAYYIGQSTSKKPTK